MQIKIRPHVLCSVILIYIGHINNYSLERVNRSSANAFKLDTSKFMSSGLVQIKTDGSFIIQEKMILFDFYQTTALDTRYSSRDE